MQVSNPIKAIAGLAIAFGATVGGARLAYEASRVADSPAATAPWAQDKMEFIAWNGQRWTGWVRDGRFELQPQTEGKWHRHSNSTIASVGWDGELWQARVDEDEFRIAHRGEWHGEIETSDSLRYRDWSGNHRIRTVAQLRR